MLINSASVANEELVLPVFPLSSCYECSLSNVLDDLDNKIRIMINCYQMDFEFFKFFGNH